MTIDLSEFNQVDDEHGVTTYHRTVETPLPENDDGSGYATEETIVTAYKKDNVSIKVRKVSDRGWSVWEYEDLGEQGANMTQLGKQLNAQEAQRIAQQRVY